MLAKANRKLDKKNKELMLQVEEERRASDQYKEQVRTNRENRSTQLLLQTNTKKHEQGKPVSPVASDQYKEQVRTNRDNRSTQCLPLVKVAVACDSGSPRPVSLFSFFFLSFFFSFSFRSFQIKAWLACSQKCVRRCVFL